MLLSGMKPLTSLPLFILLFVLRRSIGLHLLYDLATIV